MAPETHAAKCCDSARAPQATSSGQEGILHLLASNDGSLQVFNVPNEDYAQPVRRNNPVCDRSPCIRSGDTEELVSAFVGHYKESAIGGVDVIPKPPAARGPDLDRGSMAPTSVYRPRPQ